MHFLPSRDKLPSTLTLTLTLLSAGVNDDCLHIMTLMRRRWPSSRAAGPHSQASGWSQDLLQWEDTDHQCSPALTSAHQCATTQTTEHSEVLLFNLKSQLNTLCPCKRHFHLFRIAKQSRREEDEALITAGRCVSTRTLPDGPSAACGHTHALCMSSSQCRAQWSGWGEH